MEELLARIRQKDITLWLEGNNIKYKAAKGVMTKELLSEIAAHKQEIIDFLQHASYLKYAKDTMERVEDTSGYLPVSYSQQSLWFFDKMNKGNSFYNISVAFKMVGTFDRECFNQALNQVVARHESLRTVFADDEEGKPARKIKEHKNVTVDVVDLTKIAKELQDDKTKTVLDERAWEPFDLEHGPLWKITLIRLSEEEHVLLLTIHHIISDAWSNRIFLLEVIGLYCTMKDEGSEDLPVIKHSYSDYVQWQQKRCSNEKIMGPLLSYWKKKLAGYETLLLPTDKERPAVQSFSGKTVHHLIQLPQFENYQKICKQTDVTMFMYLLTGFDLLLSKYSGQTDIILGTVVANRAREELRQMIGFLMNTIVIRENLSETMSVRELLQRVKKTTLDAYTYQELPFDLLLEEIKPERSASFTPVFQVMYIHQSVDSKLPTTKRLQLEEQSIDSKIAPFDLRLSTRETNEGILCTMDYCDALFEATTIKTLLKHYEQVLNHMSEAMEQPIQAISMIGNEEKALVTKQFNRTKKEYAFDQTIHQLFEQRTMEESERVALQFEGNDMTYGQLNAKANQWARYLRNQGVSNNVPVGVCLERSFEMFISLLAVLKAGSAYIPIDPGYPKDRVTYMIQNAGASLFITDSFHRDMFEEEGVNIICLDEHESEWSELEENNLNIKVALEDLAYIIYTSGSTGQPKGAMNTQIGFLNHKLWMQDVFEVTKEDVFLQKTPFSFDVSVWEIFLPLITGAKVVIAKPQGHKDPTYLSDIIKQQKISIVHFVPSMLRAFLEEPEIEQLRSIRSLFVSGEALDYDLLKKTKEKFDIPMYNVYGPAECADVCTMWECETNDKNQMVPIGRPIFNVQVYILDSYKNPVPIGVTGEIYVGGIGVGRGYINNDELTKERYQKDPFVSEEAYMYKTGDLGKFLEDGMIAYVGRSDFQVKIRGIRIELGEIEKYVQNYPGIKNSTVIVWEKENHSKHLAVYYTQDKNNPVDPALLRKELTKHLPEYMVPHFYTMLEELPLNPSGKLDRKALPEPNSIGNVNKESFVAPENEVQMKLADIWKEFLEVDEVGIYDNFFEMGGHSLMLIQVHKKIKEVFQKDFSMIELFTYSTIQSMALFLTEENEKETIDVKRLEKQKEAKRRNKRLPRNHA